MHKSHSDSQINRQSSFNSVALPFIVISTLLLGFIMGIVFLQLPKLLSSEQKEDVTSSEIESSDYIDTAYLNQVFDYLESTYIEDLPSREELTHGAVKGIIQSLDDKYTSFLTPEETQMYLEGRTADFEGIGVTLAFDGEYTYVESVLEGFPASKSDIRPGDLILEVDGEDVTGQMPAIVASKIRGQKGTAVKIKLYRDGESGTNLYDVEIIRDKIEIDNITWEHLGEGIYKIDISQFSDETPELFMKNWDKVVSEVLSQDQKLNGLIVDLRNNPGGYVIGVRYVLEEFMDSGDVLMMEESKVSERMIFRDSRVGKLENVSLVVLVNEGSASASEIFSAAVQDNDRGLVVGTPTAGKGVEQLIIDDFSDGAMMLLVFQNWLTPNGNKISEDSPIIPDVEIEFSEEDIKNRVDVQLDKAIELLNN